MNRCLVQNWDWASTSAGYGPVKLLFFSFIYITFKSCIRIKALIRGHSCICPHAADDNRRERQCGGTCKTQAATIIW
ncbi:hypothetical protein SORBI_3002G217166 [Sorghum bicolor]|uniref:Uncharacterized protein n=1 Tax=Sorghum bicolor TaxID=4558 RepID=A0A1W0W597_SORBI|nr:hypothetical protein SORBI_3002G217166 [Sorghum bicolor]